MQGKTFLCIAFCLVGSVILAGDSLENPVETTVNNTIGGAGSLSVRVEVVSSEHHFLTNLNRERLDAFINNQGPDITIVINDDWRAGEFLREIVRLEWQPLSENEGDATDYRIRIDILEEGSIVDSLYIGAHGNRLRMGSGGKFRLPIGRSCNAILVIDPLEGFPAVN